MSDEKPAAAREFEEMVGKLRELAEANRGRAGKPAGKLAEICETLAGICATLAGICESPEVQHDLSTWPDIESHVIALREQYQALLVLYAYRS